LAGGASSSGGGLSAVAGGGAEPHAVSENTNAKPTRDSFMGF
jgi:hypothetical protein